MKKLLLLVLLAAGTLLAATQPAYWADFRHGLAFRGVYPPLVSTCNSLNLVGTAYIATGTPEVWVCTSTSNGYEWIAQKITAATTLPSTCSANVSVAFLTDSIGGNTLYACSSTNTWIPLTEAGPHTSISTALTDTWNVTYHDMGFYSAVKSPLWPRCTAVRVRYCN